MSHLAVVCDFNGEDAVLRGTSELGVTFHGLDFVFLHQEFEAFGVFGDDLGFALLDGGPVQFAGVHAFDAEFFGVFQVIPKFGVEQQCFRGDATYVQAGAT